MVAFTYAATIYRYRVSINYKNNLFINESGIKIILNISMPELVQQIQKYLKKLRFTVLL